MEIKQVGLMLLIAIGVIIGLTMLQPIASNVASTSTTYAVANQSVITPANGAYVALTGSAVVGTPTVVNASSPTLITTGYTIGSRVVNDKKTLVFTNNNASSVGSVLNISYTYEPDGYITDAAGRSVTSLIVILAGLAVLVFAMLPAIREKFGMG